MKKLLFIFTSILIALITHAQTCPDDNHPHAIDLGLPSGTLWACCNVGASQPQKVGENYAWGDTEENPWSWFTEEIYKYYKNNKYTNIGSDIAKTQYDVAHMKWGGKWQMPSVTQFQELLDNCKIENDASGDFIFIGKNGNSIFLRIDFDYDIFDFDFDAEPTYYSWNYWTSSCATGSEGFAYSFTGGYSAKEKGTKDEGKIEPKPRWGKGLVRAVYYQPSYKNIRSCPDDNHPHIIDLGLPSGTKWACCNVGATKPDDYGDYFAWGETNTKSDYSENSYYRESKTYDNNGASICKTKHDAAHVKWGGHWQMPTIDQINELLEKCIFAWTTFNGIEGGLFTGPNGRSIYLPAAGYYLGTDFGYRDSYGFYWSGTQDSNFHKGAYFLDFDSGNAVVSYSNLYMGRTVRPVFK